MADVKAPAEGRFVAAHNSGVRIGPVKNVCVHSTEGPSAVSAASWFANPRSGGSAHMVVDDDVAYRTVPDALVPWAVPGLNHQAWHLEFAGYAHWGKKDWLAHDRMLHRGAYKAALRCKKYGIPVRWVGPIGLRLGVRGLTTHRAGSFAWPWLARPAGFHTDPGLGFPRRLFKQLVKSYLAEL